MANLKSPSGASNFSGTTWENFDTTSAKTDGTTNTTVTTGNLDSAAFTPGAVGTTNGVLLNVSFRITSPTGTFKASLITSAGSVEVAAVTVNVADLNMNGYTAATTTGSWHYFKWATPFVLVAATAYRIRVTSSNSTQVGLYGGASNDWNRLLHINTATVAPAAGDRIFIQAELTGAGTSNTCTVTQDINATTSYGKIDISVGGTLIYKTSAATQLRTAGILDIWPGGELDIGTSGTPIPAGTLAILEFDNASAVQYGLRCMNGTLQVYGASKTRSWSLLGANAAASATALTLSSSVGTDWKNGDTVLLSSTTQTASEVETKALGADSSGTSIPTIAALTNAHGGDAATLVQGEVGLLDRWVKIRAVTAANSCYIDCGALATVNLSWAEIRNIGSSTTFKRGIDVRTTTGSATIENCSIWNSTTQASSIFVHLTGTSGNNVTVDNNVIYNYSTAGIQLTATTQTHSITNNMIASSLGTNGIVLADVGGTTTGNRVSGGNPGINITEAAGVVGTFSGNVCHSAAGAGIAINVSVGAFSGTILTPLCWRNSSYGLVIPNTSRFTGTGIIIDTGTFFGNVTAGAGVSQSCIGKIYFNSCIFNAGVTLTQPRGFYYAGSIACIGDIRFNSCTFGVTQTHATADIICGTVAGATAVALNLFNCLLSSATPVGSQTFLNQAPVFGIFSSKDQQVSGAYCSWLRFGTLQSDTTSLGFVSTVSEKMTPNDASNKLNSAFKEAYLNSGQTATVTVTINKNAAYNGAQPRLMVRQNDSAGITSDTVLATYSAGTGSANAISGVTAAVGENCALQFYVDADGTAGYINATDWLCTLA